MRHSRIISVVFFGGLFFLSALQIQPCQPQQLDTKTIPIPIGSIYTTSSEDGFKKQLLALFHSKDDKPVFPYSDDLKIIRQESQRMGASNIFLVRGADITAAVHCSRMVFATGHSGDQPPNRDLDGKEIASDNYWLVAYLGNSHSTPPAWRFKGAELRNGSIEFQYSQNPKPVVSSGDRIQYFYWIPLSRLKRGAYELRLIDSDKGRPALVRWVDVP